jgi:hypothetical protein
MLEKIILIWLVGALLTDGILSLMYRSCGKFAKAFDRKFPGYDARYIFNLASAVFWPTILPCLLYGLVRYPFIGTMFRGDELDDD